MKLDQDLIDWIETTNEKICQEKGFGHVHVIWHLKNGKIDGVEKQIVQTVHMIHVIWPPFLLLFLYTFTIRSITKEYHRIFRNIEVIQ